MKKSEAIEKWVNQEFSAIPQDWVAKVAEDIGGEYLTLPMWGTMWITSEFDGEKFMKNSRRMVYSAEDIDLDEIEEKEGKKRREEVEQAIEDDNYTVYEGYIDEEMDGANCVLDKDGNSTAAYIYEVDDKYVLGINGAGCMG